MARKNHPQHKPVLIRNGKRVMFSKLPVASCCVWRDVAPLASLAALALPEKSYEKSWKILPRWPRKPCKIQVWSVILGLIFELWAAPNINIDFLLFVDPFFSASGSSWSRLGRQVGPKLAPKRHPINQKSITKMI